MSAGKQPPGPPGGELSPRAWRVVAGVCALLAAVGLVVILIVAVELAGQLAFRLAGGGWLGSARSAPAHAVLFRRHP